MLTLDDLLLQLMRLLSDTDGLIWNVPQLTDCIRLSLARLQRVCPLKLAIQGLDDAEVTLLEANMDTLILRFALLQAWQQRMLQRSEIYHPDGPAGQFNESWLLSEQQQLAEEFEKLRLYYLQHSSLAPYAVWAEQENPSVTAQE